MRNLGIFAATAWMALAATQVQAQQIGVAASIERAMRATAPGQSERRLTDGADVVADDRINTGSDERGQLLFLDETTLSVAPSSQIVLDRFIYDPSGGSSGFAMQLTTGALRFVGGTTSEAQEAIIKTPTATLGIRGSSALVSFIGGRTVAVFLMGDRMCISSGGQETCSSRQGAVLTEDGYAGSASAELIASMLTRIDGQAPSQLASRGGATAGVIAATPPNRSPVSTRGRHMGAADVNAFGRNDGYRGISGFTESGIIE
tara:strand:+ start:1495 stop:2277 length:783 start_codon:yes stop_codon:yes gene_type:complete